MAVVDEKATKEAAFIVDALNSRNMTVTKLAELCKVSRESMSAWLHGHTTLQPIVYYGILYALTHCWHDTELKNWVVID